MNKVKSIHFVGIKGVGMTPLAIIAKQTGCNVSGSDIPEDFITDELLKKAEIHPFVGFSTEHVQNPDLVITTGAHGGFDNVEVIEAKRKGISVISQGEAVGVFMHGVIFGREQSGISIAGSHGKTTTTAMIATILKSAGLDPSYVIGTGVIPSLGMSGHYGKGDYFVAEADEYVTSIGHDNTSKMLWQHPNIAVITNIELDHPDVFESEEAVVEVFTEFANQLPPEGVLIVCGDDVNALKVSNQHAGRHITYGFSPKNDFLINHVYISEAYTFFRVTSKGAQLGEFAIGVSGEHNALNALGAVIVGLELGLNIDIIKAGLKQFIGSKRRFELVGNTASGALVYDDYAHHPTEIKKTLTAFKKRFPNSKLVCIFQPHMYSRTKKLFEQFMHSFNDADTVILTDIYPSLREVPDPDVSSRLLYEKMKPFYKDLVFLPTLPDVVKYIGQKAYSDNTIVITMGAGDVYRVAQEITEKK